MAARGLWALKSVEHQLGVVKFLRTFAIFISAATLLAPTLAVVHVAVSVVRALWLRILRWRFPNSSFERTLGIRTAMDTARTQGFVTLLLQIRGRCDPEAIAKRLEREVVWRETIEDVHWGGTVSSKTLRKGRGRRLAYPQLSMVLTTRWGRYAWEKTEEFKIERHVVLASSLFRGRPVTEFNVQECVSDLVSKYLPSDIPPWQATIIPVFSPEERYFILLRLHHLACKGFVLEQLQKAMTSTEDPVISKSPIASLPSLQDPLSPLLPPPTVSPPSPDKLCAPPAKAMRSLTNFIFERTSSAWGEVQASSSVSQALYSMAGLTLGLASEARNIARREGKTYKLAREAVAEALFLAGVAFEGPRILLREILPERSHSHEHTTRRQSGHHLQSVSLCGRKAVAWSSPVPSELVNKICVATGASNTEVLLTAASGAIRQFFRQSGLPTPSVITAALPLSLTAERDEGGGGFVLITLPTREEDGATALEHLRKQLKDQKNRPASLLLSAWLTKNAARILPSFAVRLLLNALTRKYSVMVSNIPAGPPGSSGFRLWGQEVEGFIFWRPQQANTSISLSLMTYKGSVRLGVMADQQLSPQHAAIANAFVPQLCDLAVSVGVPRERLPSSSNRPTSPRGSPLISPLASPRPSPKPSPRPSPMTSPESSPPILRKTKATFLQLPSAVPRRRREDSMGSGAESDNSGEGSPNPARQKKMNEERQKKQDEERAAALATAVTNKFRGAIDSD